MTPRQVAAVLIFAISTIVTACTVPVVSPLEPTSEPPKPSATTPIPEEKPAGAAPMFSEVAVWGAEPAGDISFTFPNGIAIDNDDYVDTIDLPVNRVQKFSPHGNLLTRWGTQGSEYWEVFHTRGSATERVKKGVGGGGGPEDPNCGHGRHGRRE